jgi:hypothetical protein
MRLGIGWAEMHRRFIIFQWRGEHGKLMDVLLLYTREG